MATGLTILGSQSTENTAGMMTQDVRFKGDLEVGNGSQFMGLGTQGGSPDNRGSTTIDIEDSDGKTVHSWSNKPSLARKSTFLKYVATLEEEGISEDGKTYSVSPASFATGKIVIGIGGKIGELEGVNGGGVDFNCIGNGHAQARIPFTVTTV